MYPWSPWKLVADLFESSSHVLGTAGLKHFSLHSVFKAMLDLILMECGVGTDCGLKPSVIKKKLPFDDVVSY
jgi:hypothetical protein